MPWMHQFATKEEYNAWQRNYRKKNAIKMRAYNRKYNKKYRKEHGYINEKKSKEKYPDKEKARILLRTAVYSGKIKKYPCVVCGDVKSQGHHVDYNEPLNVIWFCPKNHAAAHTEIKNKKRYPQEP